MRRPQNTDKGKHRADAIQRAAIERVKKSTCPECTRGGGFNRHKLDDGAPGGLVIRKCRYCGFEKRIG